MIGDLPAKPRVFDDSSAFLIFAPSSMMSADRRLLAPP